MLLITLLLPLFTSAFIHFHRGGAKGHGFSKCNGVEDILGISQITSTPEKARAGKVITFRIKGKLIKDVQEPLCRTHARGTYKTFRPCERESVHCPMAAGMEWDGETTIHIPKKAEALAGRTVKINVQCQEATGADWDDKATMITCIDTSIKVALWLEETQAPAEAQESQPTLAHSATSKFLENPRLVAPVVGGMILGFILAGIIIYWRIKKPSRHEVDEIWSATLVQTDIYVDFEDEEGNQVNDGAI